MYATQRLNDQTILSSFFRVCKKCIEDRFGEALNITCPLPHDDMDDEEEPCQREGGLRRTEIMPDSAIHRQLLKEKCFCRNRDYGCAELPPWKKLFVRGVRMK